MTNCWGVSPALVLDVRKWGESTSLCAVRLYRDGGAIEDGQALVYEQLTGAVKRGEWVALNTTAVDLRLGSGGYHFVMWGPRTVRRMDRTRGHLMKLRYTPYQLRVCSVEEQESPHHKTLKPADSVCGMPVVATELHSQVAPAVAGSLWVRRDLRVCLVLNDGGALPAQFSHTARWLKECGMITSIITCGHCFGGDLEAVNIYSALLAARLAAGADVTVASIGPGIVGTGTVFGHTGIQQGQTINAVHSLGGQAVVPPRLDASDKRERHRGLSHHTVTVLSRAALAPAWVTIPRCAAGDWLLWAEIERSGLAGKHRLVVEDGRSARRWLERSGYRLNHMDRGPQSEEGFFNAACAAGVWAARLVVRDALERSR